MMPIALSKSQQEWLRAAVGAGSFASIDEAIATAVQRMIVDDGMDDAELDWAQPLLNQGLAELDRGHSFSHDDVFAHVEAIIGARK